MTKKIVSTGATGTAGTERPLSKGQKSFNALTEKIQKRRATLAEWETFGSDFERRYAGEFVPLFNRLNAVRGQMVHRLDQSYDMKGLTKGERQTIADLISALASHLLEITDDPAVEEVYRRYNPSSAEDEAAAEEAVEEALRAELEAAFGVTIGDDVDLASPDDVLRYVEEQLNQQEEDQRERQKAKDEFQAKRKSTPKQRAAEERARAEEEEVHLSLRVVYRKLASVLHPDREADPAERERKAALMQRVNIAYGKRSLLDLLEIQLELEHIDQAALDNISEDRLKRWNIILKDQLYDLDQELQEIQIGYAIRMRMMPGTTVSTKSVKRALSTDITAVGGDIKQFESDLRRFEDSRGLKPWLKEMKWVLANM